MVNSGLCQLQSSHLCKARTCCYKVARYLKLDSDRMWIKTHQVNTLQWEDGQLPHGVSRARPDAWAFGMLPKALGHRMFEQVRENSRQHALGIVTRSAA